MNRAARYVHDAIQPGVSTYAGCALIALALKVTANQRAESWA